MRGRNFCLLSLLMLLALASELPARGYTDAKPLRFDLYRDYLIVARGSVGSQKGLNFLVDTGANPSVLDRRVAQKLHLQERPSILAGINGRVQAGQATVPSLQFGPIHRENINMVVADLSFFSKAIPVPIDGVMGLDVVGQTPFEIDYAASQISFGPIPSLKNSVPLELRGGLPIVTAELNHLSTHLVLDTAASALIVFAPQTPAMVSRVNATAVQQSSSRMGEFERKPVQLGSLTLGQMELRGQPAFLVQNPWDGKEDFNGLMSPALLGITRLAIDVPRGIVEFSR
jgi:predicted aspartyl protease